MLGLWKKTSPRIEIIEDEKDPLYPSQFDEGDSSHTGQNHYIFFRSLARQSSSRLGRVSLIIDRLRN
jgi:hypothetical protein